MRKSIALIFILLVGTIWSCSKEKAEVAEQTEVQAVVQNAAKVQVYYFHGDRRCATCIAVGEVSQKLIAEKYAENPAVAFVEINYDQPGSEKIVKKFEVASSGLYVYSNDKIENITTLAFQYARTEPEKLQSKLIELIDKNI